jgi:uncharacterized membrane protein YdbT with pleckstrin-like domain
VYISSIGVYIHIYIAVVLVVVVAAVVVVAVVVAVVLVVLVVVVVVALAGGYAFQLDHVFDTPCIFSKLCQEETTTLQTRKAHSVPFDVRDCVMTGVIVVWIYLVRPRQQL